MTKLPPPPIGQKGYTIGTPVEEVDDLATRVQDVQPFLSQDVVNNIVLNGDLSKLSAPDKTAYYIYRCKKLGLDPASKPFDLLKLQGKEILYANKGCAAQLRDLRKISTQIIDEREWNGLLVVRVRAWYLDGRMHEDEGYATLNGLAGDGLGNARLKAITKATRRAILHLCGLGEMDETEIETIPGAQRISAPLLEAKQALKDARAAAMQVPKLPASGSDVIQIVDIKGADDNNQSVEVLDNNSRVWQFVGADPVDVALKAVGRDTPVMVDYTVENGQYTVRNARV